MTDAKISRRGFVRTAAAAGGVVAVRGVYGGKVLAMGSDTVGPFRGELSDGTPLFSGIIAELRAPSTFTLQGATDGTRILITGRTKLWRDGPIGFEGFRPGDSITAQGAWSDSTTFSASLVEPTYFNLAGTVESISNGVIVTSEGAASITDATRLSTEGGEIRALVPGDLAVGSSVQIIARRESGRLPLVAVRVFRV